MEKERTVSVIKDSRTNKFYIYFNDTHKNGRMLLDDQGIVRLGVGISPSDLFTPIKKIKCYQYKGWWYFKTKIGTFNAITGKKVF